MGDGSLIILDTHVWLWFNAAPSRLSKPARREIDRATEIGIAAISCMEIATLAEHKKIELDRPANLWLEDALSRPRFSLLPLTPSIAAAAARFGGAFSGDPADRMIVATALEHAATLITKDDRMLDLKVPRTVW